METTAILNLKGGVAKTTTCVNAAAILAMNHGKRVLVIDADSQCNSTEFLQVDKLHPGTLAELLRGTTVRPERSKYNRIDLIPADESLMDLDLSKVETRSVDALCIKTLLNAIGDKYDVCLIDCPPAFNAASCAALMAADSVVVPIKLDAFSLRGMGNVLRQIQNIRKINPRLRMAGLLPTMYYKSAEVDKAEEGLHKSGLPVFPHIRRTPKVDDMTFAQEPLLISSPTSAAARDYRAFVEEHWKEVLA